MIRILLALPLAALSCATPEKVWPSWELTEEQADRISMERCGPEGTTDWDQNGPVCEREGWNGRSYPEEPKP